MDVFLNPAVLAIAAFIAALLILNTIEFGRPD
jgi:hypothetical protein